MSGTSFQLATVSFGPFKAEIWPLVGRILTLDEHNSKPIHPCVRLTLGRGKKTPILQATRRKLPPFRRLAKLFVSENRESTCAITQLPYFGVTYTQSVLHSTRCPSLRGAQGLESRPVHGALCCGGKREVLEGMRLRVSHRMFRVSEAVVTKQRRMYVNGDACQAEQAEACCWKGR